MKALYECSCGITFTSHPARKKHRLKGHIVRRANVEKARRILAMLKEAEQYQSKVRI